MSNELLIAAYENKRLLILNTFLNYPDKIPSALAFAYERRIAPVFHENIAREHYGVDPYKEVYAVNAQFVGDVAEHLDKFWLVNDFESVGFQKLEDAFGGYKANRMELIDAIRYMHLDRRFDEDLYKAVKISAPVEAQSIMEKYTIDDVEFD